MVTQFVSKQAQNSPNGHKVASSGVGLGTRERSESSFIMKNRFPENIILIRINYTKK